MKLLRPLRKTIPLQRFGEAFYGGMTFPAFVGVVCTLPGAVADHLLENDCTATEIVGNFFVEITYACVALARSLTEIGFGYLVHTRVLKSSQ